MLWFGRFVLHGHGHYACNGRRMPLFGLLFLMQPDLFFQEIPHKVRSGFAAFLTLVQPLHHVRQWHTCQAVKVQLADLQAKPRLHSSSQVGWNFYEALDSHGFVKGSHSLTVHQLLSATLQFFQGYLMSMSGFIFANGYSWMKPQTSWLRLKRVYPIPSASSVSR